MMKYLNILIVATTLFSCENNNEIGEKDPPQLKSSTIIGVQHNLICADRGHIDRMKCHEYSYYNSACALTVNRNEIVDFKSRTLRVIQNQVFPYYICERCGRQTTKGEDDIDTIVLWEKKNI